MKIIIHNPAQLPVIDYRKIIPIQGDLKELSAENYQKLKKSIEENGFKIPAFLWKPTQNEEVVIDGKPVTIKKGNFYNLDSHQRIRVLTTEDARPRQIPYVTIPAANFEEAKKTLLMISSQYGTMTDSGFDEFTTGMDNDWMLGTVAFDNIDFTDFEIKQPEKKKVEFEATQPVSKTGDEYEMQGLRILCFDLRKKGAIEKLLSENPFQGIICEPSYCDKLMKSLITYFRRENIKSAIKRNGKQLKEDELNKF